MATTSTVAGSAPALVRAVPPTTVVLAPVSIVAASSPAVNAPAVTRTNSGSVLATVNDSPGARTSRTRLTSRAPAPGSITVGLASNSPAVRTIDQNPAPAASAALSVAGKRTRIEHRLPRDEGRPEHPVRHEEDAIVGDDELRSLRIDLDSGLIDAVIGGRPGELTGGKVDHSRRDDLRVRRRGPGGARSSCSGTAQPAARWSLRRRRPRAPARRLRPSRLPTTAAPDSTSSDTLPDPAQ